MAEALRVIAANGHATARTFEAVAKRAMLESDVSKARRKAIFLHGAARKVEALAEELESECL